MERQCISSRNKYLRNTLLKFFFSFYFFCLLLVVLQEPCKIFSDFPHALELSSVQIWNIINFFLIIKVNHLLKRQ